MKTRWIQAGALLPLLAWGASAQDVLLQADQVKVQADQLKKKLDEDIVHMKMVGSLKGPVVKGQPYSAEEISESNQTLADGTKIHRETKTTVYRDSEGRTRRETPENITISDPVAGTTYIVNPKTNAVKRLQMSNTMVYRTNRSEGGVATAAGEGMATFSIRTSGDGQANIEVNGKQLDPKQVTEMISKAKAEGHAEMTRVEISGDGPSTGGFVVAGPVTRKVNTGKETQLGKKSIEGVIAEGTQNTETIETGAIGNDRPIEIVNEHWFSEEIGQLVYSRRSDPRSGEEIFRLTNIHRGDPPAYLFQAPADSHTTERKM